MYINWLKVVPISERSTFGLCVICGEEAERDGALVCAVCRTVEAEMLERAEVPNEGDKAAH
jgi:hypothetical protein